MIRILQIVPNMQNGGLENFIMNIYRNIDRKEIQFDFLVHYQKRKYFDDEIEKLGGKIYRFSFREDNNLIKYITNLRKFYKEHPEYKIIHCHMSSIGFIHFLVAKMCGVKVRIAHSHNSNTERSFKGFIKLLVMKPLKYISTDNFACSTEAGKFLYKKFPYKIVYNAVDIDKYRYNQEIRTNIRKKLKIEEKLVIGHIGRFELQKNHYYIIDIFAEVIKENPSAILLLAGDGKLKKKIEEYVEELQLSQNVRFLGVIKNANELYQALDCFILPSFFEGLPVVGIEAQISGLKCIFSNTITKEVKISSLVEFLEIDLENIQQWKNSIIEPLNYDRNAIFEEIKDTQYNIKIMAKWLQEFYISKLIRSNI